LLHAFQERRERHDSDIDIWVGVAHPGVLEVLYLNPTSCDQFQLATDAFMKLNGSRPRVSDHVPIGDNERVAPAVVRVGEEKRGSRAVTSRGTRLNPEGRKQQLLSYGSDLHDRMIGLTAAAERPI